MVWEILACQEIFRQPSVSCPHALFLRLKHGVFWHILVGYRLQDEDFVRKIELRVNRAVLSTPLVVQKMTSGLARLNSSPAESCSVC